jgi:hypothetical protein
MLLRRVSYVLIVLLVGAGSLASTTYPEETGIYVLIFFQTVISVLTYPAGFLAAFLGGILLYLGLLNSLESILLMTPVYALLGYLQWFWLLPRIYRKAD